MSDLKERLRTMADMINLCEKISWGMDSAIMHEAAARIEELEAENRGAHMIIAVGRAEVLQLRSRIEEMEAKLATAYDAGFAASAEGWNGEYPGDHLDDPHYIECRNNDLRALKSTSQT